MNKRIADAKGTRPWGGRPDAVASDAGTLTLPDGPVAVATPGR